MGRNTKSSVNEKLHLVRSSSSRNSLVTDHAEHRQNSRPSHVPQSCGALGARGRRVVVESAGADPAAVLGRTAQGHPRVSQTDAELIAQEACGAEHGPAGCSVTWSCQGRTHQKHTVPKYCFHSHETQINPESGTGLASHICSWFVLV